MRSFFKNLTVWNVSKYGVFSGLKQETRNNETRNVNSIYYDSETISFLGLKIWESLPSNIKDSQTLNIFKSNIESWKPENCPCHLCRLYIADVGFVES